MHLDKALKRGRTQGWVVYRLSSLGDVILTSGVMDYWRRERGWSFTMVSRPAYAALFAGHPAVSSVEILPQGTSLFETVRFFRALALRHRGKGLIDLHAVTRSHMLGMIWALSRTGPVLRYDKFSLDRRLFLRGHKPQHGNRLASLNVTQRYALAVEDKAPPREELLPAVYLSQEEQDSGAALLRGVLGESGCLLQPVALHPFATHALKVWPRDYWMELMRRLDRAGQPYFIVGQGDPLLPGDPRDFSGRTDLRTLAVLLGQASLLITADSGPMHLSGAVGTPVLALFGPTTGEWGFYPAGPDDVILERHLNCRPCSLHGAHNCRYNGRCLAEISPEQVVLTCMSMLNRSEAPA